MKLYKHQKEIIDADPKKTGLFIGTGSGKTRIALLLSRGKTLVIAPKTQVEDKNWNREGANIEIENPHIKFIKTFTCISKETFRRDAHMLPHFDTVIVDEAHTVLGVTPNIRYRNKQAIPKTSQVFDALDQYLERTKPSRLYLCTATIIRSPMTVWGAAKILGHNWDFYKFRSTFYVRLPIPMREVWAPKNDDETKNRLAVAVKKLGYVGQLSDYFDVPTQTYITKYVELTAKQKSVLKDLFLDFPDPLVLVGKKHQIENGLLTGDEFNVLQFFENKKLDILKDLIIEFPRIIIWAKYRGQIEQIALLAKELGKKVFVLTGNTEDRGGLISNAKEASEYVFIAQMQISAGWELPDCPTMVFASMSYSVVDRVQAEGRILRANALKKNLYIDIVARGGIDEAVFKSIKNKKDFNEKLYAKV